MNKIDELKQSQKELIDKANEISAMIDRLENDKDVWTPVKNEVYYYITDDNTIENIAWANCRGHLFALYDNNVFQTDEEAKRYADIDYKFKKLVFEENHKNPVDWESDQDNYYMYYCKGISRLSIDKTDNWIMQGVTYCTNNNILQLAIDLIGEEDLIWYIKRG